MWEWLDKYLEPNPGWHKRVERKLDRILIAMGAITELEGQMATTQEALDDLKVAVGDMANVSASGVEAINRLADAFEASKDDPEEIAALAALVRQNSGDLGAAIARTTPPV